jgi:hypothetical protein
MSENEARTYRVIPQDACTRCASSGADHSIPVAISQNEGGTWITVRYICPKCRLMWDCGWSNEVATLFDDKYIVTTEGLIATPIGAVRWPAGPSGIFERA